MYCKHCGKQIDSDFDKEIRGLLGKTNNTTH